MGKRNHNEQDQEESRRILERIDQETEPFILRATSQARNHLSAREAENADWTELWGRRIGRISSVIVGIALLAWLVAYFMGSI
ncbi:hypothetical protein [Chelativorans sp. YIM 93263]|uniref:hypothetical protein n=1 Tax=Chelativorans sp. YIM 93263 TaxID=2906648 RepID=UPI002379862E|nr:hypothetical protein [Chelativorans sp. YIM 93263]